MRYAYATLLLPFEEMQMGSYCVVLALELNYQLTGVTSQISSNKHTNALFISLQDAYQTVVFRTSRSRRL
ncbi:hypothetical protein Y032_0131g1618 [Ancylostoma ceylanicum]|uniref:Uncharacterized protein n=1 Tax=Ancylostoma ceylanicum TaxID=53326 RepID=A0A016T6Y4_9BILA|nr:hypothetical protein Y032_0131g1618 [Ancylostoma ceylanicum]